MWMNECVIVFLVVQRITCGVTFGGPSGGQTTTVPAPAVYKKLDCSDVYNMQKVGLYLNPLGDKRVGFTKKVQPNEYFSIFGDDTISCDVRVIAIKSDYYLKVTTDKSFDIISSSLQELLQLDSNSRTSFVTDSNTVKPNDPLILKKGLRHYASYTETHLTSIKYNTNKYKDVATPHLLVQTTPFTPNMELEVYVGYKCEAVNPNQLKICWPTHPGDVQGTYQINKKCEGVVNGFNDTEIIETQSCNSTIGWTAWSDWHLSEEEGEDPMGSENITIWRNATSCMQQGDGMSNETDVDEYWCGAEIYHIRTVQKDEYRYSDYFWAGDGECQLYHPERQVMDHLNNQEDPSPTCGNGFQVFIQTTCVKGPYSLTPESPDLCPPPGFHIVDCYIECPDQNDYGKSIEHDVEDFLVDELQSEYYNESSPLRMNMKWLPAYENTYTNGLPQAKSPDQNFIELQIKLNQPVFFERIELKLQPMPIGYPYGQVTFTSSKDSGRTWSNSSNVTYMSSGDTWVVFSPMEVKYLSDIKFHFDMQITDQTIFQVIALNIFKTKNWGNWSVWSNWTTCTNQDCLADNATWYRTRNCDNWRNDDIITINAKQCPGQFMEVAKCKCLDKFRWDEVNELEISQCEDFQTKGTSSLEPPPPDCGHGVINIAPSRCRYEGGNTMEYEDEYPHLCGTKNIQSTPCVKPCNGSYPCGEQALAETVRCSTPKYQLLPNDVIIENITFQMFLVPLSSMHRFLLKIRTQ
uniref:Cnidarian restricted protein n=1 Tax=Clytia hemisphaerica TaxID=252671 RepID=A0A7M5UV98_9CNID